MSEPEPLHNTQPMNFTIKSWSQATCAIALLGATAGAFGAETVYVTAMPSNCVVSADCGSGAPNQDFNPNTGSPVYLENVAGNFTTAISTAEGKPKTPGARYFGFGFTNSTPDLGVTIAPALGVPGGVYRIFHVFNSSANNVNSNAIVGVTNVSGGTLSFTNTDKFQSKYGTVTGGANTWQLLGYLTNAPGEANPIITFFYESGNIDSGSSRRLLIDTFRFVLDEPCMYVGNVRPIGPLATNLPAVTVSGVSSNATRVTVYQDIGSGMQMLASTNVANPGVTVSVIATGFVKGAQVAATQTVNGQEGCVPATGFFVGGGANPSVRMALNLRANSNLAGPVGITSGTSNTTIYFLGTAEVLPGTAPGAAKVLNPSTNWQTVTFARGDFNNPTDPFVRWNTGTSALLDGNFAGLDGIAVASEGDPGPFEMYLDDLENGTNGVVQGWEAATNNALAFGFAQPGFSGTTAPNILSAPDQSIVTTAVAASGQKSLRVRFQFNGMETNRWVRLVTSGTVGTPVNPQLDLNEPISIKVLLPPPGFVIAKPPGTISITRRGDNVVLNWEGSYKLLSSTSASGPYNEVPGVRTGPYTNNTTGSAMFFRLAQ